MAYALSQLSNAETEIIEDEIAGSKIVIVEIKAKDFIVGFESTLNGQEMNFSHFSGNNP